MCERCYRRCRLDRTWVWWYNTDMIKNKGHFKKGTHWRKKKPWWDRDWLDDQYTTRKLSANEIAQNGGVTESAILYWLGKHDIPRRAMTDIRANKYWGNSGSDNPMWNKRDELNPMWKGGVTPERQSFYTSREWKTACSAVWRRDNATCQRCQMHRDDSKDMPFHIHHIESFANADLRADIDNLVLLCEACHRFIHSKKNTGREYLPGE